MRRGAILAAALSLLLCACAPTEGGPTAPPQSTKPAPTQQDTPRPTPGEGSGTDAGETGRVRVHTDFSKLTPRPAPMQPTSARWYEEYTPALEPGDYGSPLIPYAGVRLMDDWPAQEGGGCLYGLMTETGVVVTDPVYSGAGVVWADDGEYLPVLFLLTGEGEYVPEYDYTDFAGRYAFAALDGSWITPGKYLFYAAKDSEIFGWTEEGCEVLDTDGVLLKGWTWEELGYSEQPDHEIYEPLLWQGELVCLSYDYGEESMQVRALDLAAGEIRTLSMEEWDELGGDGGSWEEGYVDPYTGERYQVEGSIFEGPMILRSSEGEELARIERPEWCSRLALVGGLIEVVNRDSAAYLNRETGETVFYARLTLGG